MNSRPALVLRTRPSHSVCVDLRKRFIFGAARGYHRSRVYHVLAKSHSGAIAIARFVGGFWGRLRRASFSGLYVPKKRVVDMIND